MALYVCAAVTTTTSTTTAPSLGSSLKDSGRKNRPWRTFFSIMTLTLLHPKRVENGIPSIFDFLISPFEANFQADHVTGQFCNNTFFCSLESI
jgi:hypothetical protein